MQGVILAIGLILAVAAAVRSTWSPCGWSMLSQVTPIAETGRGNRFGRTAAWFVAGALVGGLTLGAGMAAGATVTRAAGLPDGAALVLIALGALVTATLDARILPIAPPFLRRQVNEDWLVNYRPWVYGGGFGWQIGVGVSTYIMTAAVFLVIGVGILGASPLTAFAIALTFALVRGLAVLLGAPLRSLAALHAFHRRFEAWAEPVRIAVVGVQLFVAVFAAWIGAGVVVAIVVALASAALAVGLSRRDQLTGETRREIPSPMPIPGAGAET
jgi:hypothetical protein